MIHIHIYTHMIQIYNIYMVIQKQFFPLCLQKLVPAYSKRTLLTQGGPVPSSGLLSLPYSSPAPAPEG